MESNISSDHTQSLLAQKQEYLDKAFAFLQNGLNSLNRITINLLPELRQFANPPPAIKNVCEILLILLAENDISYTNFKKLSTNSEQFLQKLMTFHDHVKEITPAKKQRILKIISDNNLNEQSISMISIVALHLFVWVKNLLNYYETLSQFESIIIP
jgi:Microtubule-binding stalk of dynein motor